MFDENFALAIEIKNKIVSHFINADITISSDKGQNEYFISTRNKELYYSEEYGRLIFEINQDIWSQGIFNFYFIVGNRGCEFSEIVKEISFSPQTTIPYTSWDIDSDAIHYLSVNRSNDMNNLLLVA